jgi:hypothetical protein
MSHVISNTKEQMQICDLGHRTWASVVALPLFSLMTLAKQLISLFLSIPIHELKKFLPL